MRVRSFSQRLLHYTTSFPAAIQDEEGEGGWGWGGRGYPECLLRRLGGSLNVNLETEEEEEETR